MSPSTPTTGKPEAARQVEVPETQLSSQHEFSTYTKIDPPADVNPPPGHRVEQTRGVPTEAAD